MMENIKNVLFRIKWLLMPQEARYAYLWERTRASYESRVSRGVY